MHICRGCRATDRFWDVGAPLTALGSLHAFLLLSGAQPVVIAYPETEDGLAELAERVRNGDVVGVVRGEQVEIGHESVVTFNAGDTCLTSRCAAPGV